MQTAVQNDRVCAGLQRLAGSWLRASHRVSQRPQRAIDALPDWSGAWSMVGGTVFDRDTQTGQGGATSAGVRSHPPYNAEWEAIYKSHLDRRDKNLFPDTISNCGVPAGFPRHFNLPDPYEFVVRPEQVWVLTENGPNVLRIYTDGRKHLEDQWATYTGDSVGHWEGDTLVFTTVALKGFSRQGRDSRQDRSGAQRSIARDDPHSQDRPDDDPGADDHRGPEGVDQAVGRDQAVPEACLQGRACTTTGAPRTTAIRPTSTPARH